MHQRFVAVDSLAIQRSLTILEDRYRELRDSGEKRLEASEKEVSQLKKQLEAKEGELQKIVEESVSPPSVSAKLKIKTFFIYLNHRMS